MGLPGQWGRAASNENTVAFMGDSFPAQASGCHSSNQIDLEAELRARPLALITPMPWGGACRVRRIREDFWSRGSRNTPAFKLIYMLHVGAGGILDHVYTEDPAHTHVRLF